MKTFENSKNIKHSKNNENMFLKTLQSRKTLKISKKYEKLVFSKNIWV